MQTLIVIYIRKTKKYRVCRQTNYPNGWRRELVANFNTRYDAEKFISGK